VLCPLDLAQGEKIPRKGGPGIRAYFAVHVAERRKNPGEDCPHRPP